MEALRSELESLRGENARLRSELEEARASIRQPYQSEHEEPVDSSKMCAEDLATQVNERVSEIRRRFSLEAEDAHT